MKKILYAMALIGLFAQCGSEAIKNENAAPIEEPGTELSDGAQATKEGVQQESGKSGGMLTAKDLYGFWVGYFRDATQEKPQVYASSGFVWSTDNKINISIDRIEGNEVTGHSVVAGNDRPFKGTMEEKEDAFHFEVAEPGDDKYDGTFSFAISKGMDKTLLKGTWNAYKKVKTPKRVYSLEKKTFAYNPDVMLTRTDQEEFSKVWEQQQKGIQADAEKSNWDWDKAYQKFYKENGVAGDVESYFTKTSEEFYGINASNTSLKKEDMKSKMMDLQEFTKTELFLIRNAIYARHGYSFKHRPLRVFFDAQPWYIPVHADIKSEFTEIEKENIKLLLSYEKHAAEYYDVYGR